MIRGRERRLGAWTRVPVRQLANFLQPEAGGVTQRGAGQDTGEGTELRLQPLGNGLILRTWNDNVSKKFRFKFRNSSRYRFKLS